MRLTNAFSESFANHCHALALYLVWHNSATSIRRSELLRQWRPGLSTLPCRELSVRPGVILSGVTQESL